MSWLSNYLRSLLTVAIQWIKRAAVLPWWSLAAAARLVLAVLSGILDFLGSIIRPALRFLAYVFIIIAVVSLINDVTPVLAGIGPFRSTSLMEYWRGIAPATLQQTLTTIQALAWGLPELARFLIELPVSVLFGALGGLCAIAGRKRQRVEIFAN